MSTMPKRVDNKLLLGDAVYDIKTQLREGKQT